MLKSYYQLLSDLINLKSISADKNFSDEIKKTAVWLADLFQKKGLSAQIAHGYGNPIVVAKYEVDEALPTCLIYGHYDVQPAKFSEGRKTDPFELSNDKKKIYGRGVADNKGQFLIHAMTVSELIKKKQLGYNVIFLIEGDEEIGSSKLKKFLSDHHDYLKSDFALISDSTIIGDTPCIDAGYRGSFNLRLKLKTANTDVHSGVYGGVVPNAVYELNKLLSTLFDMNNRITIPYFYYEVEDMQTDVIIKNRRMHVDLEKIKANIGVKTIFKDKEHDHLTHLGLLPTVQITGISGGYVGEGFKNAIPAQAVASLNFRTVKNQKTDSVISAFDQRVKSNLPDYVDYEIKSYNKAEPTKVDLTGKYIKKAEKILEEIFGKKVFFKYCGGTLPVVNLFSDILGVQSVLVGLANEDCNAHGVDENFDIDLIEKGFEFSEEYLKKSLAASH